ncbi:LADA_0F07800g1_1 [Lachancea dasiensis]|uniref:LADA_0F07800g1_1 n=1 Tax=Lachancea dasiensis TaxID=1072105 RepID=A0A1G4JKQ2_9SACH|nr:LADA_0F07800g1_1 [Lachancea dasiensis]
MSAPTMRTTLLLTEHLGYPPISLIDDIINAVNELMYKCTQAMEKYLLERHEIAGKDYTDEIKVGIAKLETLWEHSIDRSFDKLELYVLRNVLHIPQELIESGSFRLRHHDSLVLKDPAQEEHLVGQLENKIERLREQLLLSSELRRQIRATQKVIARVKNYKQLVESLLHNESSLSEEQRTILKSLSPVNESVKFLTTQMRQLYIESNDECSMDRVRSLRDQQRTMRTDFSSRSAYLAHTTQLELQNLVTPSQEALKVANASKATLQENEALPLVPFTELPLSDPDWSSLKDST